MRRITSCLVAGLLGLSITIPVHADETPPVPVFSPFEQGAIEVSLDSGVLFGIRNRNGYVLAPQMVSILWQPLPRFDKWWLPTSISVGVFGIAMPVVHGPESFYGGGGLMARSRWLPESWPVGLVLDSRMGAGAIDSRGAREGQGQDFSFVLHTAGAIEIYPAEHWTLRAGFIWQHLSNANLSEPESPNTGLDSIGPQVGLGYLF